MNWRARLITLVDFVDHRILEHRSYRLCQMIGTSPFWSLLSDTEKDAHRRWIGVPRCEGLAGRPPAQEEESRRT